MEELGIKLNFPNASLFGSLSNMKEEALSFMVDFYKRFRLKCLADSKVSSSTIARTLRNFTATVRKYLSYKLLLRRKNLIETFGKVIENK
jgi:hypothetical protein